MKYNLSINNKYFISALVCSLDVCQHLQYSKSTSKGKSGGFIAVNSGIL
jgi:hypothetical protein